MPSSTVASMVTQASPQLSIKATMRRQIMGYSWPISTCSVLSSRRSLLGEAEARVVTINLGVEQIGERYTANPSAACLGCTLLSPRAYSSALLFSAPNNRFKYESIQAKRYCPSTNLVLRIIAMYRYGSNTSHKLMVPSDAQSSELRITIVQMRLIFYHGLKI